jgi:tripartite-type tricarboxylate transporter receptor subunit TctC
MEKLHQAINRSLKSPDLQARFAAMGAEIAVSSAPQAQRFYESEVRKWAAVVSASGARMD